MIIDKLDNKILIAINPKIQNPFNIWNIILKYSLRQSKTIIISDSKSIIKDFERYYPLQRNMLVLYDIKNQEKEISKFNNQDIQILLTYDQLFSVLVSKQEITVNINLIIKIKTPNIDQLDNFKRLLTQKSNLFTKKAYFIIIQQFQQDIRRFEKRINRKLQQIDINEENMFQTKSRQLISDIKLINKSEEVSCSIDVQKIYQQTKLTPQQIIKRLFFLLTQDKTKKSKYLKLSGYITYQITTNVQFNSIKYIWNFLKQQCTNQFIQSLKGMKKFKNQKGAIFQVPIHYKNYLDQIINYMKKHKNKYKGYQIQEVLQIPQIQDTNTSQYKLLEQRKQYALKHKDQLQIFIGGVPYDAQQEDIQKFFSQRKIQLFLIRILRDNQGFSKGIAFALCADHDNCKNAINLSGSKFGERNLRIKLADQKGK